MKKAFLLLLFVTSQWVSAAPEQVESPTTDPTMNWQLTTQEGREVSMSDFHGKPLIIHFWGTWCPYCKILQPGLETLRKQYESQGLQMVAISINESANSDPSKVLKARGINILNLIEGDELALETFQIHGTPSTFFVSPEGQVLGSTMSSDPNDPRFQQVAEYLVALPRP